MPETLTDASLIGRVTSWMLRRTLVRAFLLYSQKRGPMLADSITYRALFSLFAAVLLGFSVALLWLRGNPDALAALVRAVDAAVPGLVGDGGIVSLDAIPAPTGLTIASIISIVGLIGASTGAIGSMRAAFRELADAGHDDTFFLWVQLRNLGVAVGIGVLLIVSAAATFFGTAAVGLVLGLLSLQNDGVEAGVMTRVVSVVVVLVLDAAIVLLLFTALIGVPTSWRARLAGAAVGGVGLTVLQELSGLFVGGAAANPLLATFAALIALLLWINLSAQVILIAAAVCVTIAGQQHDRVHARHSARTMGQWRLRMAEAAASRAEVEVRAAQAAEAAEREPKPPRRARRD